MSSADGDDEDLMGIESSQLQQAPPPKSLEDHVLQIAQERPGCSLPSSPKAGAPRLPQGIPYNTQHLMHDMRDLWRNQGYSALQYPQEPFENTAQEYQRLLWLQVVQQRT